MLFNTHNFKKCYFKDDINVYFINLNGPEIIQQHYGESEEKLRKIFEEAQENTPSIIFFDEIDAITPNRDTVLGDVEKRVVAQLLTLMDGLKNRGSIIVIGADLSALCRESAMVAIKE